MRDQAGFTVFITSFYKKLYALLTGLDPGHAGQFSTVHTPYNKMVLKPKWAVAVCQG